MPLTTGSASLSPPPASRDPFGDQTTAEYSVKIAGMGNARETPVWGSTMVAEQRPTSAAQPEIAIDLPSGDQRGVVPGGPIGVSWRPFGAIVKVVSPTIGSVRV